MDIFFVLLLMTFQVHVRAFPAVPSSRTQENDYSTFSTPLLSEPPEAYTSIHIDTPYRIRESLPSFAAISTVECTSVVYVYVVATDIVSETEKLTEARASSVPPSLASSQLPLPKEPEYSSIALELIETISEQPDSDLLPNPVTQVSESTSLASVDFENIGESQGAAATTAGSYLLGSNNENIGIGPQASEATPQISTVQSASTTAEPATIGSIRSSLNTEGEPSVVPFNTAVFATSNISADLSTPLSSASTFGFSNSTFAASTAHPTMSNIFPAVADPIPPQIPTRSDHPVIRRGIVTNGSTPLQTNKFYANFFLGNQTQGTWTHPYSVSWSRGGGNISSWGLSVSHIERRQLAFGPGNPPQYFINPIGIQHCILSATELGQSTMLSTDSLQAFSVNVNLAASANSTPIIRFPLVQGMGFVTGLYTRSTPLLQSAVFFRTLTFIGSVGDNTAKWRFSLHDDSTWLLYVTSQAAGGVPQFTLVDSANIRGPGGFTGTIQVAKIPSGGSLEAQYDSSAGVYPLTGAVSASVNGASATNTLSWTKGGVTRKPLLMFALPHHIQSFDEATAGNRTSIQLQTTTKGIATGVKADQWTMRYTIPVNMGFAPWTPAGGSVTTLSATAINAINTAAQSELNQDINAQTNLDSMYFSGKGLGKFAFIVYTVSKLANNASLAATGLDKLKRALAVFINNTQRFPLVYDSIWKGIVSSGSFATGNPIEDFGNTYYNDHHFHYGYFVYTAAVIAHLDPSWLLAGSNRAWVNTLVRDFANPQSDDPMFPFSRSFDWYHGHSWAKGLFESADGKDEESSSEDAFTSYALKMWGFASRDTNLEARGNLMLAIQAFSLQNYFLMDSSNQVHPPSFIGNKVVGILFENKADHVTYFGTNIEYIQGIHMLPLNPSSALTRTRRFVREEWDRYFSNGRVDQIAGGWRGILYANLAIIDPQAAWRFFSQPNFDNSWLDGGASRTWYLAYVAGLGGA